MNEVAEEDRSVTRDYITFFLKNLAVRFTGDSCEIPASRAFTVWMRYAFRPSVRREIRHIRKWVYTNRFRFQEDARSITELWEVS